MCFFGRALEPQLFAGIQRGAKKLDCNVRQVLFFAGVVGFYTFLDCSNPPLADAFLSSGVERHIDGSDALEEVKMQGARRSDCLFSKTKVQHRSVRDARERLYHKSLLIFLCRAFCASVYTLEPI